MSTDNGEYIRSGARIRWSVRALRKGPDLVLIARPANRLVATAFVLFAGLWDLMCLIGLVLPLRQGHVDTAGVLVIFVFIAFGVFWTWFAAVMVLDRCIVTIRHDRVDVRFRPVRAYADVSIHRDDIASMRLDPWRSHMGISYALTVLTPAGGSIALLRLPQLEAIECVAAQIRREMEIEAPFAASILPPPAPQTQR